MSAVEILLEEITQRFIEILPDLTLRMHASGELKMISRGLAEGSLVIITILPNEGQVRVQVVDQCKA